MIVIVSLRLLARFARLKKHYPSSGKTRQIEVDVSAVLVTAFIRPTQPKCQFQFQFHAFTRKKLACFNDGDEDDGDDDDDERIRTM